LQTSYTGKNLGSTYSPFRCEYCQHILGKIYRTTPKSLDAIRDYLSYEISNLTSYQLGAGLEESRETRTLFIPLADILTWHRRIQQLEHNLKYCAQRIDEWENTSKRPPTRS
jgi:hypothetical protein